MWGIPIYGRHEPPISTLSLESCESVYSTILFSHLSHLTYLGYQRLYVEEFGTEKMYFVLCKKHGTLVGPFWAGSNLPILAVQSFTQEKFGKALPYLRGDKTKQNILVNCINCFLYY